ncbi:MAG: DUF2905 domain-containing protein [Gemmataceae bacterium]
MDHDANLGWLLLIVGLVIAGLGLIWLFAPSIPWLGRMPGDIVIQGKNVRFYFPIATCLVLSVLLSLLMWVIRLFSSH